MQTTSFNGRFEVLRRMSRNIAMREEMFMKFIDKVCKSGYVKEAFLVGSRARGDYSSISDFDLVVVVENVDPIEVAEHLSMMRDEPVPVDIVVLGGDEINDPIYREMLKDKKKLC